MKLEKAYKQIREMYPGGPQDQGQFSEFIFKQNKYDQRAMDIVARYRAAQLDQGFADTTSTVESKIRFREMYEIDPEL